MNTNIVFIELHKFIQNNALKNIQKDEFVNSYSLNRILLSVSP
jgi:hypothetical protein